MKKQARRDKPKSKIRLIKPKYVTAIKIRKPLLQKVKLVKKPMITVKLVKKPLLRVGGKNGNRRMV